MQFCMFHDRITAWNKMIAKFRLHYISVLSLVGHDWRHADDNTIDYQWTSGWISPNNLSTSCVLPIQDLSRNVIRMMIPSSLLKLIT